MIRHSMASALTRNGYCKRDVYESLDAAVAARQVQRAVSLATELAVTRNEGASLVSHLLSLYSTWYVSGCGITTFRVGTLFRALGGTPAAMHQIAADATRRASLCSAVITLCFLPRRDAPLQAKGLGRDAGDDEPRDDPVAALGLLLTTAADAGGGARRAAARDAAVLTGRVLAQPGDPAWRLWGMLEAHVGRPACCEASVQEYVRHCRDMYATGLQAQSHRAARVGLLLSAVRVCARGALSVPLLDEASVGQLAELEAAGRAAIDEVFREALEGSPLAPGGAGPACAPRESAVGDDPAADSPPNAPPLYSRGTTYEPSHGSLRYPYSDLSTSVHHREQSQPQPLVDVEWRMSHAGAVVDHDECQEVIEPSWDTVDVREEHASKESRVMVCAPRRSASGSRGSVTRGTSTDGAAGVNTPLPLYLRCFCAYDDALRVQMAREARQAQLEASVGSVRPEMGGGTVRCVYFRHGAA